MVQQRGALLVVDPHAESLFPLAKHLATGFRVHAAQDLKQAIAIAVKESLDLLVCRVRLDTCSGDELLAAIRLIPRHQLLPAIYLNSGQRTKIIQHNRVGSSMYSVSDQVDVECLASLIELALVSAGCSTFAGLEAASRRFDSGKHLPTPHSLSDSAAVWDRDAQVWN